jgi:hypothetical protein
MQIEPDHEKIIMQIDMVSQILATEFLVLLQQIKG